MIRFHCPLSPFWSPVRFFLSIVSFHAVLPSFSRCSRFPPAFNIHILFWLNDHLLSFITRSYHCSLLSCTCFDIWVTSVVSIILSLLILSSVVTPCIHHNSLISAISYFCSLWYLSYFSYSHYPFATYPVIPRLYTSISTSSFRLLLISTLFDISVTNCSFILSFLILSYLVTPYIYLQHPHFGYF